MRISYSALETFQQCPLKYKLQYIDKIKVPPSKEAVFGTLIHETLRMFHDPARPLPPTEEELLKFYTQNWNFDVFDNPDEEAAIFQQGIKMLKDYYAKNYSINFNIVDLESRFEAPIEEGSEVHLITGKIDRIDKLPDGSFEIIDYKTTKKMPSQKIVNENLQLSVYHLGLVNRWPFLREKSVPVKLSLYYLKHGEKLSTFRSAKELSETQNRILEIIQSISHSDFGPTPNALCDWCLYQPYCPMFRHKFQSEKAKINNKEIKKIVEEYFKIKKEIEKNNQRLTELKTIINDYCDKHNLERVFGDEGFITRLPQKRFSYDIKQVKEVLEPLGKWDEVLSLDTVKLRKIIDQLPWELKQKLYQARKLDKEFKIITANKK